MKTNPNKIVRIGRPKTKADKFFSKFPKVIYMVTNNFGTSEDGELREAHLIDCEGDTGLIYHPRGQKQYACGSYEIARLKNDYWVSHSEPWVNSTNFKG